MSLHEYLRDDPHCGDLLKGAVLAVGPMLADPDPQPVLAVVDGWAFELAGRMPLPWNLHGAIDVLNNYLFQEVGLQGDRETYDDPANAALLSQAQSLINAAAAFSPAGALTANAVIAVNSNDALQLAANGH